MRHGRLLADGVYVALVIKRLREMAQNLASFSRLETEIGSLPEGLEELFDHIFHSLKRSDQKIAYQTFAIILRWDELERLKEFEVKSFRPQLSMPLSVYYFIDKQPLELGYHDTFPITKSSEQISKSDRFEQARRLLMGTCKGLIEVKEERWNGLVLSFTHRSVPEFLEFRRDKMNEILGDFSPDKAICQLLLTFLENGLPIFGANFRKLDIFTELVICIRQDNFRVSAPSFKFEERWNAALIDRGVGHIPPECDCFEFPQVMALSIQVASKPKSGRLHAITSPLYIAAYLACPAYVE